MYSPQEPDPSQPRAEAYPPPPGAYPYPPQPQGAYPYPPPQQPGMEAYPPPSGAYPYPPPPQGAYPYPPPPGVAPYPYPPQNPYMPQGQKIKNKRATNAMIYGFISIALGLITLLQEAGAAGIITGTFAIIYGFTALKIAKRFPGNPGRGQAITGIVFRFVAWFLVIVSLIIRSAASGS